MQLSKIGSKNTYHKCIKQLHHAQYIRYHPPVSKFQPVQISIIRLDIKQEALAFKQLDLFASPPLAEGDLGGGRCPNIDTASVPKVTDTSTDNDTGTVPNMGQYIKPNLKQRETPSHKIFKQNEKIQTAINDMAGVSNLIPAIKEVEEHFKQNGYPVSEAKKFFNHYKALGWKIQGVTPIEDWKALVEKWMTNAERWDSSIKSSPNGGGFRRGPGEVQYLYESFLEEKKIFHHITSDHFKQLKLELSKKTLQQAWQERINQVSGTNQHSLIELWKAYLTNDLDNPLVRKDQAILIALAKRIAVLNHFHTLKQSGHTSLPP